MALFVHKDKMEWKQGRTIENQKFGMIQEWVCAHNIPHASITHECDGCCKRKDYPG